MTATADMIIERRKLRRRLTFWRILAIGAVLIAALALIPRPGGIGGEHIAKITIEGVINDDPLRLAAIEDLIDDDDVKALIIHVNSPGGAVVASENLYEMLREVAAEKPTVTLMNEYAASGGYVASLAGDYIVARGNTLTGSIGVVSQIPEFSELFETLGIGITKVKSAPLKAEPSYTEAPSPEALEAQASIVSDMFIWFRDLVAERRGISGTALEDVADGRAFTGRQALDLGLIDALGDEDMLRDWLAENREIDRDTEVVEHFWGAADQPWPLSLFSGLMAWDPAIDSLSNRIPRIYAILH
ncbi:MAG: signal peptide peptidase SppA [Pseudomonadota bacterium]